MKYKIGERVRLRMATKIDLCFWGGRQASRPHEAPPGIEGIVSRSYLTHFEVRFDWTWDGKSIHGFEWFQQGETPYLAKL